MPTKHHDPLDVKDLALFDRMNVDSKPTTPTSTGRSGASRRVSLQGGMHHSPGTSMSLSISKTTAADSPSMFTAKAEMAFNKFALTEGGSHVMLPIASVENAIYDLGLNPAASRITKTLANDGYSKRGLILQDFLKIAEQFQATAASLHSTIKNFKVLDTDNDDKISRVQFVEYIASLPKKDRIEGRSLEEVMSTLDPHHTGMINLKSFLMGLFIDLTEEEIVNAMKEHGYDPDREEREREQQRLAELAAAERSWQDNYDALLSDERMLRTEVNAEQKLESKSFESYYSTVIVEALAEDERSRGIKQEAERKRREEEAAQAAEAAAAREADEAQRKKREEEDERKRKAADEDRLKKEKEEADRKRKEEEEKKKAAAAAAAAQKAAEASVPDAKDKNKKEEGGCCVIM